MDHDPGIHCVPYRIEKHAAENIRPGLLPIGKLRVRHPADFVDQCGCGLIVCVVRLVM
jgi:hypothetical protein